MTEEMKKKITAQHEDEVNDHKFYLELSKEALANGNHTYAGILKDIAHDEHTHANALKHILDMEEEKHAIM